MNDHRTLSDRLLAGYFGWTGRFLVWAVDCDLHSRLVVLLAILLVALLFSAVGAAFAYNTVPVVRLLVVSLAVLLLSVVRRVGS